MTHDRENPAFQKQCMVADRCVMEAGSWRGAWNWRIHPRGRALSDMDLLKDSIGTLSLSPNGRDQWSWSLDPNGIFSVKKLSHLVDEKILGCPLHVLGLSGTNVCPKK